MEARNYIANTKNEVPFHNHVDYCIGTGRMGLALHKEYLDQLKFVQDTIGFKHIRGHGLFTDDMAIYQEHEDENGNVIVEYNFTYLDMVMDSYIELGIRPFLELGFMPDKLASDKQTIFYWRGNVTPPKSYDGWCSLVQATLNHLCDRYGRDEVVEWPIEVWNEPNLPGFWQHASKEEYFKLFKRTFYAIKEVDERFQVGGPAVCGGTDAVWINAFMDFCSKEKIPVDYVTRHHYTTEFPERKGHYGYAKLSLPEDGFQNLGTTRTIIDAHEEYKGLPIHITEFNTSYIPNCPVHDTNQNAAYIAGQLSRLGDYADSYSYWTFGDIFEERGVPFTPFYGGFGLVANGGIPKPTFWTFYFFKQLQGKCVLRTDDMVVVQKDDGSFNGVAWNLSLSRTGRELSFNLQLPVSENESQYSVIYQRVDEDVCNPLKVWHDMGEPSSLSKTQKKVLISAAQPEVKTDLVGAVNGTVKLSLELKENAVVYFEARSVNVKSDPGYDYERVMKQQED